MSIISGARTVWLGDICVWTQAMVGGVLVGAWAMRYGLRNGKPVYRWQPA